MTSYASFPSLGCRCEPKDRAHWVVEHRHCNYSAFNGYHWTWSRYSRVRCVRCNASWRTAANYVGLLPDATRKEDPDGPARA